jgi:hypothetical protein
MFWGFKENAILYLYDRRNKLNWIKKKLICIILEIVKVIEFQWG